MFTITNLLLCVEAYKAGRFTHEKIKNENPEDILKVVDYHPENIGKITDSSNRAGCYIRKAKVF